MGARHKPDAAAFGARFCDALARLPLASAPRRWLVAFSGGLDSSLLLHQLKCSEPQATIVAIHVDHGLHPDSGDWSAHCARVAGSLGVDFRELAIAVAQGTGASLEAVAREARYTALASEVGPGDVLLTAHHADDQLETILLRLLRGTGVRGLAAIHAAMPLGEGLLARPLLAFTRADIRAEAEALGLDWLEDPSNADTRFDRNFLRVECLPVLRERWPAAGVVATRLARQMAEAESLLAEVAADDLGAGGDPGRIPIAALRALSAARRNNALRHAVRALGLPPPNAAQLAELARGLSARPDAETFVSWPGVEARFYRGHLYLSAPSAPPALAPGRLRPAEPLRFGAGELRLVATAHYGIPDRWARAGLEVGFRQGGERFRPHRSRHHKSLKQWFQESGVVPWMRGAVPLIYHGDRLVAVADLCLADDLPQAPDDAPFWRPIWTDHPRLR